MKDELIGYENESKWREWLWMAKSEERVWSVKKESGEVLKSVALWF